MKKYLIDFYENQPFLTEIDVIADGESFIYYKIRTSRDILGHQPIGKSLIRRDKVYDKQEALDKLKEMIQSVIDYNHTLLSQNYKNLEDVEKLYV